MSKKPLAPTPGDWQFDPAYKLGYSGPSRAVIRMNGIVVCELRPFDFKSHGDMQANGNLIATAKELLEALKWSLKALEECAAHEPDLAPFTLGAIDPREVAKIAISKAEGGAA